MMNIQEGDTVEMDIQDGGFVVASKRNESALKFNSEVQTPPQSQKPSQILPHNQRNNDFSVPPKQPIMKQSTGQIGLRKVRSSNMFAKQSMASQQKRMRLKQYLFSARQSLQKNREQRMKLRHNSPPGSDIRNDMKDLRRQKYHISNEEMHRIVKKGIETNLRQIISSLQSDLSYIEGQDLQKGVSKEDLVYFYDIKMIVVEKIKPMVEQMRESNLKRQNNLIGQIFSLGRSISTQAQEEYLNPNIPCKKTESKPVPGNLLQSLLMQKKDKE